MKLPPGAAALISQVTPCSEAEAEADACPASSEVGHTTSVSGLGGSPVTLNGSLYLTGPLTANAHHGAGPFGLLAKTLAHAGPFELGYVNVFSTININPETAAATVTSGQIPDMLKGVPVAAQSAERDRRTPGKASRSSSTRPTAAKNSRSKATLTGLRRREHADQHELPVDRLLEPRRSNRS